MIHKAVLFVKKLKKKKQKTPFVLKNVLSQIPRYGTVVESDVELDVDCTVVSTTGWKSPTINMH